MQELSTVLTPLSIAAGLAIVVERILEVLKHIMHSESNLSDGSIKDVITRANHAIKITRQVFSNVDSSTASSLIPEKFSTTEVAESDITAGKTSKILRSPADDESDEFYPPPRIQVTPATQLSTFKTSKIVFLQLAAAGLGMILANIFNLQLLSIFMQGYGFGTSEVFLAFDTIFTGLIIGGGSQPIHVLIRFITERKINIQDDTLKTNTELTALVDKTAKKVTASIWQDINYQGGINPESLQNTHLRPADPTLIIYHHTAMTSTASFQDIVDEFLITKKWLTGYHCVVMPNGAIRPFCRWDRSGNHVKGNNARSLGISFHGNFHTQPGDKYSNADGRYGNKAPTLAQLRAGARVIALWLYLYDGNTFDSILSHQKIMPNGYTNCPGSNFPEQQLRQLVRYFYESWAESRIALDAIALFKKQKYIYVTE